jgi:hypothetical protein
MATRRRIEEVRGAASLSIGPDGRVSLPRDSSETLALLLSRGLLCAERDDHANGRPLVYRAHATAAVSDWGKNARGGEAGDGGKGPAPVSGGANPRIKRPLNTKLTHSER